jgi:hypothetical protein
MTMNTRRFPQRKLLPASAVAMVVAAIALQGCYQPGGGWLSTTDRGFVYISTPTRPVSITLIDTRNNEPFFHMDIPPGKQLTFKFIDVEESGERNEPSKMLWEVWDAPTEFGSMNNQMICPPRSCRRIDVNYRPAPEDPLPNPSLIVPPAVQPPSPGPNSPEGGTRASDRPQD